MDQFILKYLRGELSLEERHQLNKWLEEDPKRGEMLKAFEMYWQHSRHDFSNDRSEVMRMIRTRTRKNGYEKKEVKSGFIRYLRYAAIFILISGLSILSYSTLHKSAPVEPVAIRHIEKTSLAGQNISLKLPDGSNVKLNAESKLIVPEVFTGDNREVELTGEAFFEIEPDPQHPFIIHMKGMSVEVLGTSFNVRAYEDEPNQVVAVKTGKVKVRSTQTGNEVQLTPHEQSILSLKDGDIVKRELEDEDLAFGWTEKKVIFKDQDVFEVFDQIERWFGVEIKIERSLSGKKLYTARHDNPTLEEVLRSLSFVYEFEFRKENEHMIVIN